jgi:hypothetical protein
MNAKMHAIANAKGRPLNFFTTAEEIRGYTGVAALLDDLQKPQCLFGNRCYHGDWFRGARQARGIEPSPQAEIGARTRQIRQASLQAPQLHRHYVRPSEG